MLGHLECWILLACGPVGECRGRPGYRRVGAEHEAVIHHAAEQDGGAAGGAVREEVARVTTVTGGAVQKTLGQQSSRERTNGLSEHEGGSRTSAARHCC